MDDIKRPVSPQEGQQLTPQPQQQLQQSPQPTTQPLSTPLDDTARMTIQPRRKKTWVWLVLTAIVIVLGIITGAWFWYQAQLGPVNKEATARIQVTITPGATPTAIAQQLKDEELIKNTDVFALYTRLNGTQNLLQAGSYHLSQSETLPQIVDHLVGGKVDSYDITFLPGATLAENREVFIAAGYEAAEVDAAFDASYKSSLFQDKPSSADLEGYIYGETYKVSSSASVADILAQTFTQFETVIEQNDLVAGFRAQGLSLYQGITLASIIQRESIGGDEPQIAQVFFTRLAMDMQLGSDVTYQYIADKTGVPRTPDLDSPYNTRRYNGLPPGPIAAPGLASLRAVANPAAGDFVYFLSGDDDVTYFARTFEEHEANIADHCQQKCQIL